MTLEEFANTLSTRPRNVMLDLSKNGWRHTDNMIHYIEMPWSKADIKDVFKHMTKHRLMYLDNCGKKSINEIVKALEKQGIVLKDK